MEMGFQQHAPAALSWGIELLVPVCRITRDLRACIDAMEKTEIATSAGNQTAVPLIVVPLN